jgi:hypothetical protein
MQPPSGVRQGSRDHKERSCGVCDEVQSGGGTAQGEKKLHGGDPCHLTQHSLLCGPHQLRHQVSSLTHQVQQHRPAQVEDCREVVLCIPLYPGVCSPRDLPVKAVQIEDVDMLDLGLGRSIYSKAQVEEFLKFQDSQVSRRAYLPGDCRADLWRTWRGWVLGTRPRRASKRGPHQCDGVVIGSTVPPVRTYCCFYFAWTPYMEHGEASYFGDCESMYHLQSQGHGPLAPGRVLEPAFPDDHQPSEVGQRVCH